MEQRFSSSKVTVEYFDPYDVYKLLAPGLIPRLPLRDLNWQSHAGPLRSINTLHIELVPAGGAHSNVLSPLSSPNPKGAASVESLPSASRDDGFQTAAIGGRVRSSEHGEGTTGTPRPAATAKERRHQIPGLRRTPYLKVLLVRCDDNDTYKSSTRSEIREWIKANTAGSQGKAASNAENHDAFEWLIIHVVLPNSVAATQPRVSGKAPDSSSDTAKSTASRWRGGSSTLLEKMRADFNGSAKGAVDRVRQIRIGINDVPYNMLPRVVPAVPTGYQETEQDAEVAWADLISKFKELILASFDRRVGQYEEDIKERDAQRSLPGWNFCTFFILKEGLARGFESVGLVEDALVVYDELSVGLDNIIQDQAITGSAETHGGALLSYTEDLKELAQKSMAEIAGGHIEFEEEEAVDLQSGEKKRAETFDSIPISSSKKSYRDLILANKVSVFDFRCYIFSRQIALLLRLANASSTREELLAKLKEQQELVPRGVAPRTPAPKLADEPEILSHLAEICKRTLEFVPAVSAVMRADIISAMTSSNGEGEAGDKVTLDAQLTEVIDNMVASFAFSVAQQILAQTSTKALPIPPSTLGTPEAHEQKASIPEPKTIMHPARSSSLIAQNPQRPPPSPVGFPGPGRPDDLAAPHYLKAGLEELAAQRAELCALSRNILEECGKKRGWTDGWASVPTVGETGIAEMEDISLDETTPTTNNEPAPQPSPTDKLQTSVAGVTNALLRTALSNKDDFYRLYETLIDKALRHYTVAGHAHSVQASMADLAVLKFHLGEYRDAAFYFYRVIPFFGEAGWSLLELSMLVMYARCLKALGKVEEYVGKAVRQLLCKAAAAERERLKEKSRVRLGKIGEGGKWPEKEVIKGFLTDLLEVSRGLEKDVRIPLASLFCGMGLGGPPLYDDGQDSFSLFLDMHSLLVDEFEATAVSVRMSSVDREIWLQTKGPVTIRPGPNKVRVQSNVMMAGTFEVDQIRLCSGKVLMHYERDVNQALDKGTAVLKNPRVTLYQRTSCLDVQLMGAQDLQLDKKKSLDLELSTGWNEIKSCEVKIKSATGGLRLVMSEAEVIGSPQPTKSQGGAFAFGEMRANSSVRIRFPFTVEQDLLDVTVRAEVTYTTEKGTFTFFKASSVPISLALEVNVQDIFKHEALFSRFAVSTANDSPLRLLNSELLGSDLFETHFGQPSNQPVLVFPNQPASLLYKINRKPGSKLGPKVKKTLYLKLYYSVIQDEIEELLKQALTKDLETTPLKEFSKLVVAKVLSQVRNNLSAYDLEKATLLSELPTSFLASTAWEKQFNGLGSAPDSITGLSSFLRTWLAAHTSLPLSHPSQNVNTILIPVDIPSVAVVHTADIRLQSPVSTLTGLHAPEEVGGCPTVTINQLLPATLHLKWTRIWDTGPSDVARDKDLEFGYEITAAGAAGGSDTGLGNWLVGGRRRGHFVIPAFSTPGDKEGEGMLSSTEETEADIPLMLIPLREGYLPFPGVEIRQISGGGGGGGGNGSGEDGEPSGECHCETDFRNLGEAVCVVGDRGRVTVSLDNANPKVTIMDNHHQDASSANGAAHLESPDLPANSAHEENGPPRWGSQPSRQSSKENLPGASSDLLEKFQSTKGKLTDKKEKLKQKSQPPGGFDPTPLPDAPPGYTVKFTFHRAYNLPIGDLHVKSSDPFIHATLTAAVPKRHKEDPPLTHRTRTVRRTTEPVWEEDWVVANVPSSGFTLKCRLYDEDWPDHDDRLGNVTIKVPHVDENWEGLGRDGRVFEVKKRSGSKRAYLIRGAIVVLCGNGPLTPRLHVSIKVLGKSDPPHAQMYTVGPTTWVKHYSPMIGRLTGVKVNIDEQDDAASASHKSDRQTQKYDFQANEIQLSGPVPPRLYHRYVEFRPMIGRMFSSRGIRGRILHKVLRKQHNRIYNYDSGTEYGSFEPCSKEASLQFLRMAHFDEGGRIFTYVITLDGMMRFTETGKEFGIDLLSKHTMHSDVATYIACAGEFFIRRLAHPAHRHHHGHDHDHDQHDQQHDTENEKHNRDKDGHRNDDGEHNQRHDDSHDSKQHGNTDRAKHAHHNSEPSTSSSSSSPNNNPDPDKQPTHPPSSPPGGPPTSPPPPNPELYQLIIDNDSGTYRPDKSVLPDLRSFLSRNFPGIEVIAMHCADEQLSAMKKAQLETKKREGPPVRMVLNRSPSGSSFSSDDESRLAELEGGEGEEDDGGHDGAAGEVFRSKKERAFEVVSEPRRWREVLALDLNRGKASAEKGKGKAATQVT
ncbi:hypothetical protein VTI74DRAFT_164 [Chaetomium olivicolor]